MTKITSSLATLAALVFGAPLMALAAPVAPSGPPTTNITDVNGIYCAVTTASNWLFWFVMVIAVIILLMGAIMFFTAGGNEDQITTARRFLTYALVGVVVAVLAKSLIFVVGNFFGASTAGFFGTC